jgi:hypothetical protein
MPYESAIPLSEFLSTATGKLSEADREDIVDQASILLDQLYAHLPLKRAMFAIDPLQRLRLLRRRVRSISELTFHREVLSIFTELRDLHTLYVLPEPFRSHVAVLPFQIEEYFDGGARRYLVSKVGRGVAGEGFAPGVTVSHWSGVPIERAVELAAAAQPGGNDAARRARGVSALTLRALRSAVWPDEEWVTVTYRDGEGQSREVRFDWRVLPASQAWLDGPTDPAASPEALAGAVDRMTEAARRARKRLYAPDAVLSERRAADLEDTAGGDAGPAPAPSGDRDFTRESRLPDNFSFRTLTTPHGDFGYVRIWCFEDTSSGAGPGGPTGFIDAFADEMRRILSLLPRTGLILDVRGNGGGRIPAAERLLELLTPAAITPASLHFRSTPLVEELCRVAPAALEIDPWRESIAQSVETGAVYSSGHPFVPFARSYNRVGQEYHGPVVLIVDALSYSATDIFAAGFQDHRIGPVLGTAESTGAGGANVWAHETLADLLRPSPASALRPLPQGASFVVAIRQVTRVGPRAGVPLEDLGVKPDRLHLMTRNDLLNRNEDLLREAAKLLSEMPLRDLSASAPPPDGGKTVLTVTTRGLSRLDVFVNERPFRSLDVADGATQVELSCGPQSLVELVGLDYGVTVARRRLRV